MVTLLWHVCKYKVHKLHQMYVFCFSFVVVVVVVVVGFLGGVFWKPACVRLRALAVIMSYTCAS